MLGDLEHPRFRLVEDLAHAAAERVVGRIRDFSAGGEYSISYRTGSSHLFGPGQTDRDFGFSRLAGGQVSFTPVEIAEMLDHMSSKVLRSAVAQEGTGFRAAMASRYISFAS